MCGASGDVQEKDSSDLNWHLIHKVGLLVSCDMWDLLERIVMNELMRFLANNSAAISAIATVAIAVFSVLTWRVSRQIHRASLQRDKEVSELYLNLVTALVISGRTIGNPESAMNLFEEQRKQFREAFTRKPERKQNPA